MESNRIEIRECKAWNECLACELVQRQVWELPDDHDVVPAHMLITAVKNGGLLLGSFDRGQMLGFAFSFIGMEGNSPARRFKHCSHMLAVLPAAREKGLGARLKWQQRAHVLAQGIDLVTWTYDPLQATNAHLNLSRLGAFARRYIRDAYGEMRDGLNAGIASDRFEVEWELNSSRVVARARNERVVPHLGDTARVFEVELDASGLPRLVRENGLSADRVALEIPSDINTTKRMDLGRAVQWRAQTRKWFERAFAEGFVATGVVRQIDSDGNLHAYYVLEKGTEFANSI